MSGSTGSNMPGASRWRTVVWGGAALLLLAPWLAMQFTAEVQWTGLDFAVFGALLLAAAVAGELALRASGGAAWRAGAGLAIATSFLLVWANLAVGFFGDGANPTNLMVMALPLLVIAGGVLARFRAAGMARTLVATAAAQALLQPVAWLGGWGSSVVPTLVFVALWLGAAWLFRRAAAERPESRPSAA